MQRHRHQTKGGVWLLGALVPVVVVAIAAIVALTPGQVLAETEPEEADESVCDGLSPLTMGVNTLTLQRQGELTKHRQSMDGKCRMSLTLVDVSSEDQPADRTKTCTVTATPQVYGKVVEIVPSESGECDTVDYYIDLAFADDYASDSTWVSHSGFAEDEEAAPDGQGVSGASGCFYTARAEYPHRSGRDVSAHGWWWVAPSTGCPDRARVSVWLQGHRCLEGNRVCWWQTVKFKRQHIGPKNLTNKRVTARRTCSTSVQTGYRNVVHVNPDGNNVGSKTTYSIPVNVFCRL
ncbi:MAG: hypothetical protein F4209_11715 [Chloroflexi bacterium]|nr:hypothetical protein [Chloroflexota bacterium]